MLIALGLNTGNVVRRNECPGGRHGITTCQESGLVRVIGAAVFVGVCECECVSV